MPTPDETTEQSKARIKTQYYRRFDVSSKPISNKEWLLKDYRYTNHSIDYALSNTEDGLLRDSVPKLVVWEYQPDLFFNWRQKWRKIQQRISGIGPTLSSTLNAISSNWSSSSNKADANAAEQAYAKSNTDFQASFVSGKNTKEYRDNVLTIPISMYKEFFDGKYVAHFEIPFTGDQYMTADGYSGWSVESAMGETGIDLFTNIQKAIQNLVPMDLPIIPEWNTKLDYMTYETEFILYNDDFDDLKKNFLFLNDLVQGAFWMQVNYRQFSPNVYTVMIPGLTRMIYAGMKIKITQHGNRRKLTEEHYSRFNVPKDVDLSVDTMFPDAWKVSVSFTSLIPNNYNTFIDGLLTNEFNAGGTTSDTDTPITLNSVSILKGQTTSKTVGNSPEAELAKKLSNTK